MSESDALTLMSEGLAFVQAGNFALAEDSYASALESAQATMGEAHPMTASLIGHLARAVLAQDGKAEFAVSLLERQVYMYENDVSLQGLVPERLTALQELAGALDLVPGRSDDAVAASQKAASLMEQLQNIRDGGVLSKEQQEAEEGGAVGGAVGDD